MPKFEYRVVPAPRRAIRVKGLRTNEDRFAYALEGLMNEMGAEGWEYVRADILPCEERAGLSGRRTVYHNMLVFRRFLAAEEEEAPKPARVLGVVDGGRRHAAGDDAPANEAIEPAAEDVGERGAADAGPDGNADDDAARDAAPERETETREETAPDENAERRPAE